MPKPAFEICEEDFSKTVLDYLLFEQKIDAKSFADSITRKVLYSSTISKIEETVNINIKVSNQ